MDGLLVHRNIYVDKRDKQPCRLLQTIWANKHLVVVFLLLFLEEAREPGEKLTLV